MSHPRFDSRIDVLDLLINILKDHEESLSEVVDKLNAFLDNFSPPQKKNARQDQILEQSNLSELVKKLNIFIDSLSCIVGKIREFTPESGRHIAIVDCRKWSEFKELSAGSSFVIYEIDVWNVFSITSTRCEFIFRYSERLPLLECDAVLEDSVCRKVLNLDPPSLRRWLSKELRVPEEKIVEGNLYKTLCEGTSS